MAFKSLNSFSATVAKATSNDLVSPKQKHLDTLLQRINTKDAVLDEISVPLLEKLQSHNWQTNFKAVITLNFLIQNGNEKFLRISARKNRFSRTQNGSFGRTMPQFGSYRVTAITWKLNWMCITMLVSIIVALGEGKVGSWGQSTLLECLSICRISVKWWKLSSCSIRKRTTWELLWF